MPLVAGDAIGCSAILAVIGAGGNKARSSPKRWKPRASASC